MKFNLKIETLSVMYVFWNIHLSLHSIEMRAIIFICFCTNIETSDDDDGDMFKKLLFSLVFKLLYSLICCFSVTVYGIEW